MKLPIKIFYGLEFLGARIANFADAEFKHQVTPKSYMNFGCHDGVGNTSLDFLNYAEALLQEVIDYSLSPQYAKDLEEVSNSTAMQESTSSRFEFNNRALKFPNS